MGDINSERFTRNLVFGCWLFGEDCTSFWRTYKKRTRVKMSLSVTKGKFLQNYNEKKVMRCDALFHLMKIRTFTKQNILRINYSDENGILVSTNALRLKFGTIRLDDATESEIVYFHFDVVANHHILYRSVCCLEKDDDHGEWKIKHEKVLSRVEICHLEELLKLYMSYVEKQKHFNLTTLRKIACKKNNDDRSREVYLQNFASSNEIALGHYYPILTPTADITRHVLQLQLHSNCVVFSHKQYDFPSNIERSFDYLVKKDVLAYVDFLKLSQMILALESERNENTMNNDSSSVFRSSILKLDYISEQLSRSREKNKVLKRKRRFRDICDEALRENTPPLLLNTLAEPSRANDLFFVEDLVRQM